MVNGAGTLLILNAPPEALLKATDVGVALGSGNLMFVRQNTVIA